MKYSSEFLPAGHEATIVGTGSVFYGNPGEVKTPLGSVSGSAFFGAFTSDRILHLFSDGNNAMQFSSAQVIDNRKSDIIEYADSGAISVTDKVAVITKASAAAMTLAAPSADGQRLLIVSSTVAAHVVTCPDEIIMDGTDTPKDTLTFAAQIGANVELMSYGSNWILLNATNVTGSDEA